MRSHLPKTLKYALIMGILLFFQTTRAQLKYENIISRIDSLAGIGLPKSALGEVDRLEQMARRDKNAPQQVKAVIYRMTFQSYLEENALTGIISRLKLDINQAAYPVKPVLQSLLAEIYWKYYQQNRYNFNQRSKMMKPDSDFTNWDLQTIIGETSRLYRQSLADAVQEQNTPIGALDGVLEGDTTTRYLRPSLYDLLLQRALDFYLGDEPGLTKPRLPFSLNNPAFFSDGKTFASLPVITTDTASTFYQGIKYLQQATAFHLEMNQEEALAGISLQRLKFLYGKSNADHKDSLYLSALNHIASAFAQKPVSSEALVLIGQYYQGLDSLHTAHDYYKQATAAFPESLGGKNAASLAKEIEAKELSATVEDENMPGQPLLALLSYKNLASAKIAVYRLSAKQLKEYTEGYMYNAKITLPQYKLNFIKQLQPVQDQDLKWADKGDYRKHSLEFKLGALPPGNYVLYIKDGLSADATLKGLSNFRVSRLAYTTRANPNGNTELRVMDRQTGKPLNGVKVALDGRSYKYDAAKKTYLWEYITDKGATDENGLFSSKKFVSNSQMSIDFKIKGDTLIDGAKYVTGARDNTDDDNDPEDKTILFTDRQIYRPGQTIYFKGLQLQTLKGKSKIVTNKTVNVDFLDVNDKQVSTQSLKTNEFGTFSGNFIIPQSMLDGDVEIKTDDGTISVKVEEYKRPTFQVEFLPVKESHKLNDSVTIEGKVTAFSGYGLSQAKVAYHITRSQNYRPYNYRYGYSAYRPSYNYETAEIKTDTITTDAQGNYAIKFKAVPGETDQANVISYSYAINADVTDATGETHTGETSVTVGNNDISIVNYLPQQIFTKDSIKTLVSINNLNSQPQKGVIKVEVYALQNAGQVFKNRLWLKPDQYLLAQPDFKKDFPDMAYGSEDVVAAWPRLNKVVDININIDGKKPGIIDLEPLRKQPSGIYQVIINARNDKGDTTSVTQYVNLIADPAKPSSFADWVIPVLNEVKPGGQAEFLVGIDQQTDVLIERYNGAKLVSSEWTVVDKGQQSIKSPIADTDKNASVQFMMVYHNRIYSSYQKVLVIDPNESLKIRFLTFRNKLQPGEKERWKLQISNLADEKQAAEMLAGLYDASLDDITPAQNWERALDNPDNRYQPTYFAWNTYDFIRLVNTDPISFMRNGINLLSRNYEHLNLFGYSYYGGFNSGYRQYLERVKMNKADTEFDKSKAADYSKNAARVKNGYDITGTVVAKEDGLPIPGVSVRIKGSNIGTQTNSKGAFKIKVPANGTLLFSFVGYLNQEITTSKEANLSVILVQNSSSLNEVVVVGYGVQRKKDLTGAVISIRGTNTIYGSRAADTLSPSLLQGQASGVAVIQEYAPGAGDKVKLLDESLFVRKPITIRKNFNETAFFYPQLHTDNKGQILIDFTIPEALTKWRFKAFAHTKELQTGYLQTEIVTQKQLSISANMPRFLREGDTLTVSARLSNLSPGQLKGEVNLQLFNALNMQPVALLVNPADAKQQFEVAAATNKAVSFKIVIPQGLDALTYRLTAEAGNYSDGEENTMPVLPNRMLVTESMPVMVRAGQSRSFTFDKLLNNTSTTLKSKTLTLEYTQNPAWYAVQALPYMMEFPYECSEQVFSRYYANSLATSLVNRMPVIKQVFDQWKSSNSPELLSNLEKNQELKSTLLEETPWLRDATSESEQKKRIALLFDLNKMSSELQLNLDKLQKRQLPDGGFPWFGGEYDDRYITQHILAGIGQLYHLHIADEKDEDLKGIAGKALGYLEGVLLDDDRQAKKHPNYETRNLGSIEMHAWYVRSYYPDKSMSKALKICFNNYLQRAEKQWQLQNIYEQGMIALAMQRNGKPLVSKAIIRSLKETAHQTDDMGMYWGKNLAGYYWYQAPVETQCLLIELFTEAGGKEKAVEEMKIWLLRSKQTSNWKTTKATAAACYALLMKQEDWLTPGAASEIKLDGKPLSELKPNTRADAGTGYIKTSWADEQINPALGKVEISNKSKSISWGAMHWQYLEQLDKINPSQTDIHLERKYFILKQTDSGPSLTTVDADHQPKTGDLLKVVVYLKAGRDFEYVQLKDMRPAGTEPVDALSENKYQDGLSYYQVTKDVATNFFISNLNKGSYVFEYRLRVAQPGNFSTGITEVQSMYAPEFNAHSEGKRLVFKP